MASSANVVNFGVRHNKAIERSIVFGDLRRLDRLTDLAGATYVGLGSVWFVDFEHAHRDLSINSMISIEGDDVMYRRAVFNRPYRSVEVIEGMSYDVTPELLKRPELRECAWVTWLDYDRAIEEATVEELTSLARQVPDDSVLIATFNAHPGSYGDSRQDRARRLGELFGDSFFDDEFPDGRGLVQHDEFQAALAATALRHIESSTARARRVGGFVPAFNIHYRDGAPMVTVGGVLPSPNRKAEVTDLVGSSVWRGQPQAPIESPPLTAREVSSLKTLLPAGVAPTRTDVRSLGFDLEEGQLDSFASYYLDYPLYVQSWR